MRNFVITTDFILDLPIEYIKEKKYRYNSSYYYNLGGITYGDEVNLTPKEFYDRMRAGLMPTTMASNPQVIRQTFQNYINLDLDILHISFSSGLSGGCSNVMAGARDICEENPDVKIIVIDTLNASLGEGIFVIKAVEMKEEGKTID